jgi:hypothetical protein
MGTDIHAFVEYADGGTSISGTPEWYLLGSFSLGPITILRLVVWFDN